MEKKEISEIDELSKEIHQLSKCLMGRISDLQASIERLNKRLGVANPEQFNIDLTGRNDGGDNDGQ